MQTQLTLLDIGMQLNGAREAFYAERKEQQPDSDMLGQLVEDFRDELDKLENQTRSLHSALRLMEENLEIIELSEA